jgi:hypothetical protein
MSAKVYIEIFFPALSKSYDFTIPASMGLSESIDLMANLIVEKEKMDIDPKLLSASLALYDPEKQDMLNLEKQAQDLFAPTKIVRDFEVVEVPFRATGAMEK